MRTGVRFGALAAAAEIFVCSVISVMRALFHRAVRLGAVSVCHAVMRAACVFYLRSMAILLCVLLGRSWFVCRAAYKN